MLVLENWGWGGGVLRIVGIAPLSAESEMLFRAVFGPVYPWLAIGTDY